MTTVQAITPLALLCIGDVIEILITNKTFFKAKAAKTAL